MKIVILTQYFHPETGAPQNRLLELSNMLMKKGWDVRVVTAMPNYPKGRIFESHAGKFSSNETIGDIPVKRYWLYASNAPKTIPRIISMLTFSVTGLFSAGALRKFRPDFVFTESPPLTLAFTGYLLSKYSGAKFVMNVSDIWPLSAKELGSIGDGRLYRAIESLEKFLYRKASLCTGQSEEITAHLKESGAVRTYLFRNGVDVNRFAGASRKADSEGKLRIVYAGLLGVAQRVLSIVRNLNFESLDAELHIYGEGAERKQIEELISSGNLPGVFLHKSITRDEVPGTLIQYDAALIPLVTNIYGAVPSKIYEALAAGLPVLFSGSGEGAKIVKDTGAGLVSAPGDFEALSDNIRALGSSPAMRKEMSERAVTAARERFDRNKLTADFADKLESMLK